ncbi:IAGLU [Symbiodinium pilosum]|uniref:IAGLU protein n=1 Tax=Symbiodinium pilosum TaxID=2952 RepID=A0A812LEP8_SYMPI|nr:IAGLU [Symbiodinium pilosum]
MVHECEGDGFGDHPVSAAGASAFEERVSKVDVECVVFEANWGGWSRELAAAHGKKAVGFMPSYRDPFRAAYCSDAIWNFDGHCIVRNRPQDIDNFGHLAREEVSFVIADCLVGRAVDCGGRRRFGAFLPGIEDALPLDAGLQKWLDAPDMARELQTVTLVALGSQSALGTVSKDAEVKLMEGCLLASPRVLAVSRCDQGSLGTEVQAAITSGRLFVMPHVPQWAVLNHACVRCFVSHGGANSTHEALASGVPVVPLPFFDDQFYIASRLEELYGYSCPPLRKATLRSVGAVQQDSARWADEENLFSCTRSLVLQVSGEAGAAAAARSIVELTQSN